MKYLLYLCPLLAVAIITVLSVTKSDSTFGAINRIPVSTSVWVTSGADKEVVATTTVGRQYLEISNVSGATTSPAQALYCNVNGAVSALYSGFVIHASSTKVFDADNLYSGAIHCRFPVAGGMVTVMEY